MDLVSLLVQAIGGVVGGNVLGKVLGNFNLGFVGNTLAGIIGGGAGGYAAQAMGIPLGSVDPSALNAGSLLANLGAGAGGGGALMVIAGLVKSMMNK